MPGGGLGYRKGETLVVYWDGRLVGRLRKRKNNLDFHYDVGWLDDPAAPPISNRLLKGEGFSRTEITAFFENLMMEGDMLRVFGSFHKFHHDRNRYFGFFREMAQDCAGALTVLPESFPVPVEPGYVDVTVDLISILARGHGRGASLGLELQKAGHSVTSMISGCQDKIVLHWDSGRYLLPVPGTGAPTTWLLKPDSWEYECVPENEAFCLSLARQVGIPAAEAEIRQIEATPCLMVRRYDRYADPRDGRIKRFHQVDFCQVRGVMSQMKYEYGHGGVGFAKFRDLLASLPNAGANILAFLDQALFNYLVGNGDAHAKNLSLLFVPDSERAWKYGLAPAYDILSTQVYPELSRDFAMAYGGQYEPLCINLEAWRRFASEFQVSRPSLSDRMLDLARKVGSAYPDILRGVEKDNPRFQGLARRISNLIRERVEIMVAMAQALAPTRENVDYVAAVAAETLDKAKQRFRAESLERGTTRIGWPSLSDSFR